MGRDVITWGAFMLLFFVWGLGRGAGVMWLVGGEAVLWVLRATVVNHSPVLAKVIMAMPVGLIFSVFLLAVLFPVTDESDPRKSLWRPGAYAAAKLSLNPEHPLTVWVKVFWVVGVVAWVAICWAARTGLLAV